MSGGQTTKAYRTRRWRPSTTATRKKMKRGRQRRTRRKERSGKKKKKLQNKSTSDSWMSGRQTTKA